MAIGAREVATAAVELRREENALTSTGNAPSYKLVSIYLAGPDNSGSDNKRTDSPFSTERTIRSLIITATNVPPDKNT